MMRKYHGHDGDGGIRFERGCQKLVAPGDEGTLLTSGLRLPPSVRCPGDGGVVDRKALVSDGRVAYAAWYSHLPSSLTLASAGEDLVFAQSDVSEDHGIARIVVVTTSLVLTADLNVAGGDVANPFVSVVPRSAIESIKVRAGQGVDVEGSRKLAWPESLAILAKYRGLDESLELRGAALVQHDPARIGPIWKLLDWLRSDLGSQSPAG